MERTDLDLNRQGHLGRAQRQTLEEYLRTLSSVGGLAWSPEGAEMTGFVEAIRADLAEARVVAIDGEVVFDPRKIAAATAPGEMLTGQGQRILAACQSAYVVRTNGRVPVGFAPGAVVWPGPYRLYVAPRTNLVVGADVLATNAHEHARRMHHVLLAAQRLDEATLAENRRGRLTEAQRQTLATAPKSHTATAYALLAFVLAIVVAVLITSALTQGKSLLRADIVIASLVTLGLLALLPSALVEQRKKGAGTKADAAEGRVELRQGPVHKSHTMYRSLLTLTLRLGEQEFEITERPELFAAVIEGHTYRAWVAPNSGRLMALEITEPIVTR